MRLEGSPLDMQFASTDLDVIEEFMTTTYARTRFGTAAGAGAVPASVERIQLGPPVRLDRLRFGPAVSYVVDPGDTWRVCAVRRGLVEHTDLAGETVAGEPGRFAGLTEPGISRASGYDILSVDPAFLPRETTAGGRRDFTHRPAAGAEAALAAVIDHVWTCAAAGGLTAPPVIEALARYVTAAAAAAFPLGEGVRDAEEGLSETVQLAIAFLKQHAREDLSIAQVASAAFVTPRAVQLAFRTQLGTTPLAYLRGLRLAGAHDQLRRATAGDRQTVASVARDWNFGNPGRFAIAYRAEYRHNPSAALQY
ncbi:AraC family transcriptional regulator [Nocardia sp. NPDC050697]|uniref:helix-turn-helix transcriptional regulator n=1 Tax=Nocardia sp. NPDC050697 TaxID=3155158 RepID=UPI003404FFB5